MTKADTYRVKAAEMAALARKETNRTMRDQFEALERAYLRLAVQADKNAWVDIAYETPSVSLPLQQQQQQQPQKKEPEE